MIKDPVLGMHLLQSVFEGGFKTPITMQISSNKPRWNVLVERITMLDSVRINFSKYCYITNCFEHSIFFFASVDRDLLLYKDIFLVLFLLGEMVIYMSLRYNSEIAHNYRLRHLFKIQITVEIEWIGNSLWASNRTGCVILMVKL